MKDYRIRERTEEELQELCRRPVLELEEIFEQVRPILEEVRREGEEAVRRYTRRFDGTDPDPLILHPAEEPEAGLPEPTREAIDTAFRNIYRFHKAQLPRQTEVETMPGVRCRRVSRPLDTVGLYVPGGTAILPSTLLMLGIPAALAGCRNIVVATPPNAEGGVGPEIRYIARKVGASHLLLAGGAQAVAAMAWGMEGLPKADKILGPGNQYVTAAKMLLQNSRAQVAIDMPAGPSEVLVIADAGADPRFVAADLLSQAEHGPDSQVVLVYLPGFDRQACLDALEAQLADLPRAEIARQALEHSFSVEAESLEEAFDFSNRYAPEHLVVQCKHAEEQAGRIRHAGSVFLGRWTPESAGDYASGTNHTLPTYGYARMYSGVSVDSFLKQITMQSLSREGLRNLAPAVERLAQIEGLEGHRRAVTIRLESRGDESGHGNED
ncbi:MAG: histidinol dehydrogenase [Balneolaceae bacterium]|nr:histidinol dehydrogenase [Balneolaceae bacterium]